MKTVKTTIAKAIMIESELDHLLKHKAKMKLKLELTEIQLKLKDRTGPAIQMLQEFFSIHGKPDGNNGNLVIERFMPGTRKLSEEFKEVDTINNEPVEFECQGITLDLLEDVDTQGHYPELIRLIMDNKLERH